MDVEAIASIVVKQISNETSIEGAFLAGSAVGKDRDEFAEIDICIATIDNLKDLRKAYGMREDIFAAIGEPLSQMELDLEHAKMASAVYGKSLFPPYGLRVDLVFCQLKYANEQIAYSAYQVLFDRSAQMTPLLAKRAERKPKSEIERELKQHLNEYRFYLQGVLSAFGRKDHATAHALAEQMRVLIYYAAAVRAGSYQHGVKRGLAYLTPDEKWVLEHSFQTVTHRTVQKLTDLYLACLTDIQTTYKIEEEVALFEKALPDLL